MKMSLLVAAASMLGLVPVLSSTGELHAAELKVLAGGSLRSVLTELGPQFERASGHKLDIHFDTTPNLIRLATSGDPFDMGVVPIDVFKDETANTRFRTQTEFARVGYGVAVREGAPKPDISTLAAFRKTLLDAKSITFLPASAAGAYILKVFDRLGIDEAMRAKTVAQDQPTQIVPAVVKGDAELAVFVNNVLTAPGVEIVGPFPAEVQQELIFPAAVALEAKEPAAAQAFIDFLKSPAAASTIKAKGMRPGSGS
ncbi:MAG TPA: substrate-binding domain-containing protein [Bradyrhizobium sp.]|jgi:molybdate transport system substrate-binding protein|uniref:molybdate ABC transporter substrate-binding protein n=1 Tax=Bradyrhizobium sp. TaxID=376 RepID=UPI002C036E25|nr:substrate-binding domain-containing protein [Bradyrhizobium sp.]HXB78108.1 substrate-binding domain-containing protein [Bradyrhizobium sp.]